MSFDTLEALCRTSSFSYNCLFSIDLSWLYAHG
jgi:hypothetical protein